MKTYLDDPLSLYTVKVGIIYWLQSVFTVRYIQCSLALCGMLASSALQAADVAIYYDSQGASYDKYTYSYQSQSTPLYQGLQQRLEAYGHTVTVIDRNGDSSSLDLSSYDQFWDIRAVTEPDATEQSQMTALLGRGGYVFLMGENTGATFTDRNAGIISYVSGLGETGLGSVTSASSPTDFADGMDNNPRSLSGMAFPAAAGLSGSASHLVGDNDRGTCLTADASNRCTAVTFQRSLTDADAAKGTVTMVFDVNFMQLDYYNSTTNQFLDNLIAYAGEQAGIGQVYAGQASVDMGSSDVTLDTSEANGEITSDIVSSGTTTFSETGTGTFSGDLSGSGDLVKTGAGTLNLSGSNSHTGGTTVSGGLLGFTCPALTGDITNNANMEVTIPSGETCTWSGAMTGSGAFEKKDAGTLILTGTSDVSGATTISAGTFTANGSIASSIVTLADSAVINGTGTIGGLLAQSGSIIRPGNSIGTLNISGDFDLGSGSTLEIEFNSTTMDKVVATGDVTLAGAVSFLLYGDDGYFTVTQTIVESTGGTLSGTFSSITVDNDFTATVSYSGTAATATISKALADNAVQAPISSQAALVRTVGERMAYNLRHSMDAPLDGPEAFFDVLRFRSASGARGTQSDYTTRGNGGNIGLYDQYDMNRIAGAFFFADADIDRNRYRSDDQIRSYGFVAAAARDYLWGGAIPTVIQAQAGMGWYQFTSRRMVNINDVDQKARGAGKGNFAFLGAGISHPLTPLWMGQSEAFWDLQASMVRHGSWEESGLSQNNARIGDSQTNFISLKAGANHTFMPIGGHSILKDGLPSLGVYYAQHHVVSFKKATADDGNATYHLKPLLDEEPGLGLQGALDFKLPLAIEMSIHGDYGTSGRTRQSRVGLSFRRPL